MTTEPIYPYLQVEWLDTETILNVIYNTLFYEKYTTFGIKM